MLLTVDTHNQAIKIHAQFQLAIAYNNTYYGTKVARLITLTNVFQLSLIPLHNKKSKPHDEMFYTQERVGI